MGDEAARKGRRLDARLRTAIGAIVVVGGIEAIVAVFTFGVRAALSVAAGSALAAANLYVLAVVIRALLPSDAEQAKGGGAKWAVFALIKMAALLAVVGLLLHLRLVEPLALVVGFGALPIGIAMGSLVSDRSAA